MNQKTTPETRLRKTCSMIADKLQMARKWRDDEDIIHWKALLRRKQDKLNILVKKRFEENHERHAKFFDGTSDCAKVRQAKKGSTR